MASDEGSGATPRSPRRSEQLLVPPGCFDADLLTTADAVNAGLRNIPQLKLSSSQRGVTVRRESLLVSDYVDPRRNQFLTAAVGNVSAFHASFQSESLFRAWSFACHEGDYALGPSYEVALLDYLARGEDDDQNVIELRFAKALKLLARMCDVNVYLWEGKDMVASLWAPDGHRNAVVLLRVQDGRYSAIAPAGNNWPSASINFSSALAPIEFTSCVPQGAAKPPESWGRSKFRVDAEPDEDEEKPPTKLSDILYPSLDARCGCVPLLTAVMKVPQLACIKRYLICSVAVAIVRVAIAAALLGVLEKSVEACCDSIGGGRCDWSRWHIPNVSADLNGTLAKRCEVDLCARHGYVLESAVHDVTRGVPGKALGGTLRLVLGAAAVLLPLVIAVALLATRAIAVRAQKIIAAEVLRWFRAAMEIAAFAFGIVLLYYVIHFSTTRDEVTCDQLETSPAIVCAGLQSLCGATLHVDVALGTSAEATNIGLAAALLLLQVLGVVSSLLPLLPPKETLDELHGTVPDTSVFRVNQHCPDGPRRPEKEEIQREIYIANFDENGQVATSDDDSDSDSSSSTGAAYVGARTEAAHPEVITNQGANGPGDLPDHSGRWTRDDAMRRAREVSGNSHKVTIIPSVRAAIERIGRKIESGEPDGPAYRPDSQVPRPVVTVTAERIRARRNAKQ
jgi:hypothetical protein